MHHARKPLKTLLFALLGTLAAVPALAQAPFPDKPVSLLVPFPPGGVADIVARNLQPVLERRLGQPVLVLNKVGAGGAIGTAAAAAAKPDGHTLMVTLASVSTTPEQERINNRPPAYALNQFTPVARISLEEMMLAVRAESPYRSVADVVADARRRPGQVSYASSGSYGVYHMATEMFADAAGVKFLHAPYNGGAPALLALLSGQIDVGLVTRSVGVAHLKSGKLRPLAAWGEARWKDYPEVPTIGEAGYKVEYNLWSGVFAPAGVPAETLKTLREAVKATVADAQLKAGMDRAGAAIFYLDGPEFQTYWDADAARLIKVVQKIGKIE